jgi:hypothetical protein
VAKCSRSFSILEFPIEANFTLWSSTTQKSVRVHHEIERKLFENAVWRLPHHLLIRNVTVLFIVCMISVCIWCTALCGAFICSKPATFQRPNVDSDLFIRALLALMKDCNTILSLSVRTSSSQQPLTGCSIFCFSCHVFNASSKTCKGRHQASLVSEFHRWESKTWSVHNWTTWTEDWSYWLVVVSPTSHKILSWRLKFRTNRRNYERVEVVIWYYWFRNRNLIALSRDLYLVSGQHLRAVFVNNPDDAWRLNPGFAVDVNRDTSITQYCNLDTTALEHRKNDCTFHFGHSRVLSTWRKGWVRLGLFVHSRIKHNALVWVALKTC